jgi:hypothetical protein
VDFGNNSKCISSQQNQGGPIDFWRRLRFNWRFLLHISAPKLSKIRHWSENISRWGQSNRDNKTKQDSL